MTFLSDARRNAAAILPPGAVVGKNVGFQVNFRLRRINGGFERREKIRAVLQQGNQVTCDVARCGQRDLTQTHVRRKRGVIGQF